jgi:Arc/MetJ family transcription regulator
MHLLICHREVPWEAFMRTTLAIKEDLLNEVKMLSGAKTKKDAVEKALLEFIRRRKAKKLLDLEGKVELSFTVKELIERRRRDVPHR